MARTQTIEIPDELRNEQRSALEQRDRFILGVVQGHKRILPRQKARRFGRGSLFRLLGPIWQGLSEGQKDQWRDAAVLNGISGWQLFISDNAARIRNELPYPEPPSMQWQVNTGHILIQAPANSIKLRQEHPQDYYVVERVPGQWWKEQLTLVQEIFSLPLELQIRYKSNLTAEGGDQSARYYADIWTSYQGEDINTQLEIPFTPVSDWATASAVTSGLRGILVGYTLYIEIVGYRGDIQLDNIRAIHSGTNWARDPRFNEMDRKYRGAFTVAPNFWQPDDLPEGSQYFSQYQT